MVAFTAVAETLCLEASNTRRSADEVALAKLLGDLKKKNLSNGLFSGFLDAMNARTDRPASWTPMIAEAKERRKTLKAVMSAGRRLRKEATFVGVERVSEGERHLVSEDDGIEKNFVILEGARAIILWTMDGATDNLVTPDKIFGAIVYNCDELASGFSLVDDRTIIETRTAEGLLIKTTYDNGWQDDKGDGPAIIEERSVSYEAP
ncbi:hypothetical protein EST38_g14183 [Candolleomyces aberdarensis]|uniref:Uncharacterized protein n=1 Tax=Candolleomyces aberdarensis TaxID=2316362 RepID=A0A4Q2CZ23_9AGAR|nr:hypothetical protein EST38_g14183 [Candolleomyces aberdarensis]